MIPSVSNHATPLSPQSRHAAPAARQGSAVASAEEAVLRAIDRIAGGGRWSGIEHSQRQEDRAAVDSQRPDIQPYEQDEAAAAANLIVQKTALQANVAVLKTTDRIVGTLLDIFA